MFLCSRFIAMSQINNKTTNNLALDISNNILRKEQFISLKVGWTVFHILSFLFYIFEHKRTMSIATYYTTVYNYTGEGSPHGNKENLSNFSSLFVQFLNVDPCVRRGSPTHMKTFALQRHFNNGSLDTYTGNSSIIAHTIESRVERGRQRGRNNKSY